MINLEKYENNPHFPVMIREILNTFTPIKGKTILDCTFGAGGYSKALLENGATVIALDRDPTVKPIADKLKEQFPNNFSFHLTRFSQLNTVVESTKPVDGVVMDLGVSTMQLKSEDRGFSYQGKSTLDMRMEMNGFSAKDFLNTATKKELADTLWNYAEEKHNKKIADAILEFRKIKPIETTKELADIIHKTIGVRSGNIDSATRTFQAIRIHINNELTELEIGLKLAVEILSSSGILAVVSFHSLEDKIVKGYMQKSTNINTNRHLPQQTITENTLFSKVDKVLKPKEDEIKINPPSRSAKLRVAIKI